MPLKQIIVSLFRPLGPVSLREKIISAIGGFLGIFLAAFFSQNFGAEAAPLLIASMGASSVLLYGAPHTPMAQPWPFVGGHLISAVIGVTCFLFIPEPLAAAAAAVALAIFAMHLTNCLHPPGGATALAMVIGGVEMHRLGYGAVLDPVGLNVVVLMVIALLVNNLSPGRRYPMLATAAAGEKSVTPMAFGRMKLSKEDIKNALRDINAYIDVAEKDLEEIYSRASLHAVRRRMGEVTCRDIMTRDVATAEYGDELATVWEMLRQRKLKGAPVVDRARRVIGIVTIVDFLKRVDQTQHPHPLFFDRLRAFIRRTSGLTTDKPEVIGEIMSAPVMTAREDTHIVSLIPMFSEHNIHHVPIVDKDGCVTGMVTQTDLSVALYRYWAAMP
ncbi:MAG: HPP family protein [Gammaproteobacteria bacterium]|nr:HPP family protein [Gammaproteobacteria bacterium]MDH3405653.1 HPP family protein [Gammaproteobacteria bacterium]MDH5486761.1 HPP family protein [Gammaproteobacteria bacterium]